MLKTNAVKRISAFFLALMMILGTLPLNVFAEGLQGKTASPIVIDSNTINKKDSADKEDPTTGSKTHIISFNPNGGSGKMKPVEVADGKNYTLPKNEFKAPEGKKFKNWLIEDQEQKEGYILTVTRDLEIKAQWEEVKENPIKKALNSLLGKENKEELSATEQSTSEIKKDASKTSDDLELGDEIVNKPLKGDEKNTSTSSDGRVQIRNFEVFWTSTNEDTIVDTLKIEDKSPESDFDNKPNVQINWEIAGKEKTNKGDLTINIPSPMFYNEKELYYPIEDHPIPLLEKDSSGNFNYDADYGDATFAYFYDKESATTKIVNIQELAPGASGVLSLTFGSFNGNPRYVKDEDVCETTPSIELNYEGEKLKTQDKTLKIKQDTSINEFALFTELGHRYYGPKEWRIFEDWKDAWGDHLKPKNDEDYWYVEYCADASIRDMLQTNYNVELTHTLGDILVQDASGKTIKRIKGEMEIIAQGQKESNFDDLELKKKIGSKDSATFTTLKNLEDKEGMRYSKRSDSYLYTSILVKIPAKKLGLEDMCLENDYSLKFTDNVKAKVIQKNSTDENLSKETTITSEYTYIPDATFVAPKNDFVATKKAYHKRDEKHYSLDIKDLYTDKEIIWNLENTNKVIKSTYDPSKGKKDDIRAYGQKHIKYELIDDHLYLNDKEDAVLTEEDYSVKSIAFRDITPYKYQKDKKNNRFTYFRAGSNIPLITVFAKKGQSEDWVKLAEIDYGESFSLYRAPKVKAYVDGVAIVDDEYSGNKALLLPEGFSGIKLAYESKAHGVHIKATIKGTLHPSDRIKEEIKASAHDNLNMDLKLVNSAVFNAYDSEGNEINKTDAVGNFKLESEKAPKIERNQKLSFFSDHRLDNNTQQKQFEIPVSVSFVERVNFAEENNVEPRNAIHRQTEGILYHLLPKGVTGINKLHIRNFDTAYDLIPNWRSSGRTMLVLKIIGKDSNYNYPESHDDFGIQYNMVYPWDSYKDFGSKLDKSLIAYESGFERKSNDGLDKDLTNDLENGYKSSNPGYGKRGFYDENDVQLFNKQEIEWMKDLNPKNTEKRFLYQVGFINSVSGDTEANVGLSHNVRTDKNPSPSLKSSVGEGGSYQYNIRLQAAHKTSVTNLVFFDSIENHALKETDEYYGLNRWKGTLTSIDLSHPITKGIDPKVYVSTIPNLDVEKNSDLSNTDVWTLYKEGDDLSKVQAIAIDLRKNKDGSDFILKENTAINVNINMKAPWELKEMGINPKDKAINSVYAASSITTELGNTDKRLLHSSSSALEIEPALGKASIVATKRFKNKDGGEERPGNGQFTFNLIDSKGNVVQTQTNDYAGKVSFKPIEFHSWELGEYVYKIVEVKGEDNTIIYDDHEETVRVKVERVGDSSIKTKITYDEDGAVFENTQGITSVQFVRLAQGEKPFAAEEVKNDNGIVVSHKIADKDKNKVVNGAEYTLYYVADNGEEQEMFPIKIENDISEPFEGLEPGKYKLVETKAPEGYFASKESIIFELKEEEMGKALVKFISTTDSGAEIADMPSTGGQGTKALMIGGGVLLVVMASVFVLANKKKKELNK